jgi:RHS repeat-associated protein
MACSQQDTNCGNGQALGNPIGSATSRTYTDYSGVSLKTDAILYQWQSNPAYLNANLIDLPAQTSIKDASGSTVSTTQYSYDEASYSPGGIRGDLTTTTEWLNGGASPVTHTGWNGLGMKAFSVDANGNTTTYSYSSGSNPNSANGFGGTNPTASCNGSEITSTVNALKQTVSGTYDCNTGLLVSLTDANTNTTTVKYDAMQRIQTVTYPPVPAGTPTTTFTYLDVQNTVTKAVLASPNPIQSTQVVFDSFGREVHRYITDSPSRDEVDTSYDADGRVQSVTNPYRSGDPVYATSYTYDALNRKTLVQEPDGNVLQTCYDGLASTGQSNCSPNASSLSSESWTDTTDESGNHWQHVSDALGRLVAVVEPGLYATNYTYDALGNLTAVSQLGNGTTDTPRTRSFTYNSLSRLLTSTNPETGQICYGQWSGGAVGAGTCQGGYDANGNLLYKTDARGLTLAYTYDALNRLTFRTASDGSPIAAFGYDGNNEYGTPLSNFGITSNNAIGRMSLQSNQVNAAAAYSYDPMGRLVLQNTVTPYIPSWGTLTSAQYDLAGNMTSLTYPDGQAISQTFDAAGRLSSVNNAAVNASYSYLNVNSYDAAGHVTSYTDGSGTTMTEAFNNRQQPISLSYTSAITPTPPLWSKSLQWTPNGNLSTAVDNVLGMTRQFTYDNLNRLMSAQDYTGTGASLLPNPNGLSQSFSYDSFGNIQQTGNSFQFSPTYLANNRMFGYAYDASGNLLGDNLTNSMIYDANERIATLNDTNYTYLPAGDRIEKKSTSSGTVDTIYFGGRPIARFGPGSRSKPAYWTDLIYGTNGLLAETSGGQTGTAVYRMLDHLGTEIGSIDSFMNVHINDYAPFGQAISSGDTDPYRFTGKERDAESGNDYFGARYYGSSMGRFMSPDDGEDQHPSNPQSWNLYSYGRNNPLIGTDDDGNTYNVCDASGKNCSNIDDKTFEAEQKKDQANGESFANGTLSHTDANGNSVKDGSFTHDPDIAGDPASNIAAMGQIGNQGMAGIKAFTVGSIAGAACVVGCPAAGAAALTAGRALYFAAAGLLPAVPSAIEKLQKIGVSISEANELIESPTTQKLIDNANGGNINYVADVGGKLVRITTDPNGQRIISAGIMRANQVANGIANGRFTK